MEGTPAANIPNRARLINRNEKFGLSAVSNPKVEARTMETTINLFFPITSDKGAAKSIDTAKIPVVKDKDKLA